MPCYSCSSEFGFLKKEVGCDVCGFSFCTRCCKKREVPSKQADIAKKLVCNKCYDKLTSSQVKMTNISPPLAHKKRMDALKKKSFSVDSGTNASSLSSQWPNVKDKEIAERLQKLKRDRVKDALPSEDDIAERLAKLKGIEPAKYKAPPIEVYRPPDRRTSIEQAAELLKQVALEAKLDSRLVKPEDEIAARLARLRDEPITEKKDSEKLSPEIDFSKIQAVQQGTEDMDIDQENKQWHKEDSSTSETASKDLRSLINDPEYQKLMLDMQKEKGKNRETMVDEDEEAEKLVEKLLATPGFDEELESLDDTEDSVSKSEKDTTEEFPWCVICSEDAKIRCLDCDSDIYCYRCFKECHENFDITDHRTRPYLPDKN